MFKWFKYGIASVSGLFILLGIIIGIGLTIIFNLYIDKQQKINAALSSEGSVESEPQTNNDPSIKEVNDTYVQNGTLTFENYQRLQTEMSYEETVKILGAEGRIDSERGNSDSDSYSVTYLFTERGFKGIEISASFLNGSLSYKTFSMLAPIKSAVTITAEQFDEMKSGMSYKDVKGILGGEGILFTDFGFPDGDRHSQTYRYNGEAADTFAYLTFDNNELTSKSQNSLD